MSEQPASAAALAEMIGDRSDEEINSFIAEAGKENVLGPIFQGMQERFLPEKAADKAAVIQYDIGLAEGTESYQVDVHDGTCTTSQGTAKEPTVTLALSGPDFLRLVSGKLDGVQAFMSGKLKLKGDMMLAQTMQRWFDQS